MGKKNRHHQKQTPESALHNLARALAGKGEFTIRLIETPREKTGAGATKRFEPGTLTDLQQQVKYFCQIANNAWRANIKMIDGETGQPLEEMKRVHRHIESILSVLKDAGFEIMDPKGQRYDSGLAVKVVSSEPTAGLTREEIKETLSPSILWKGQLMQMGEVVVGTPIKKD